MATKTSNKRKTLIFRQITPTEITKGELRKLQIVEGTVACLARHGLKGTNYETVARACGMVRPHVAYHYPDWDELLLAACRFVYATGQSIVVDYLRASDIPLDLRRYIEGTFHWIAHHRDHAAVITALWHLATVDEKFRSMSTEVKALGSERVFSLLYSGELKRSGKRWATALSVHALIVGRCVAIMTTDPSTPLANAVAEVYSHASALRNAYP